MPPSPTTERRSSPARRQLARLHVTADTAARLRRRHRARLRRRHRARLRRRHRPDSVADTEPDANPPPPPPPSPTPRESERGGTPTPSPPPTPTPSPRESELVGNQRRRRQCRTRQLISQFRIEHGSGLRPRRDPRAGGDDLREARPWTRTPLIVQVADLKWPPGQPGPFSPPPQLVLGAIGQRQTVRLIAEHHKTEPRYVI